MEKEEIRKIFKQKLSSEIPKYKTILNNETIKILSIKARNMGGKNV